MTRLLLLIAALSMTTSGAMAKTIANPPTDAQLTAFYNACIHVAPEATVLCKCKKDAAPKLIDAEFMDIVIASIKGKPRPSTTTPTTTTSPARTRYVNQATCDPSKPMKPIKFEKEERAAIVAKIQRYFVDELDSEIGAIPAELLLNFFTEQIGPFYYNQGLGDAQAAMARMVDNINDEIYGLEQREARAR